MNFEKEDGIKEIIEFYTKKWSIVAIYLTGSRANNTARFNSDYDLHIVYKDEMPISTLLGNIITDVKVINFEVLDNSIIETPYAPAVPFKQIFLNEKYFKQTQELEDRTNEAYNKGPNKWNSEMLNEKQQQMFRFLDAIKNTTNNPIVCFRHMCKFFDFALNYWFLIRGEWSKSTHQAIIIFQKQDPSFYAVIFEFIQENNLQQKTMVCERIYKLLFGLKL